MDAGGFGVSCRVSLISKSGRRQVLRSIHSIKLPGRARDFAEYATETFNSTMWTVTGSDEKWRQLIEQASELKTPYLVVPEMPGLNRPGYRIAKK